MTAPRHPEWNWKDEEIATSFPRRRESSGFKQNAFFVLLDSRLRGNDGRCVANYVILNNNDFQQWAYAGFIEAYIIIDDSTTPSGMELER